MYYHITSYLREAIGNNAIDFEERKNIYQSHSELDSESHPSLRIPTLIQGTIDDVKTVTVYELGVSGKVAYEYIADSGKLISAHGLENLVEIRNSQSVISNPQIYIIDNHNHAFYCRWKTYLEGKSQRGSHLIHIDQHSDLNEVSLRGTRPERSTLGMKQSIINKHSTLEQIAKYTNEVLDIASFIKPAKEIGLISDYEIILTEYSLLTMKPSNYKTMPLIVDIDLDFRAPEMSITEYDQTINQVRKLISLPQVGCVTIATSPTYIDQNKTLKVLTHLLQ